jgi:hypothetical protein
MMLRSCDDGGHHQLEEERLVQEEGKSDVSPAMTSAINFTSSLERPTRESNY